MRVPQSPEHGAVLAGNARGDIVIAWPRALVWRPYGGRWSDPVPLTRWNSPTLAIGDAGDAVAVYSIRNADEEWEYFARTLPPS